MTHDYDVIIAGAGLAGNCLGLALRAGGLSVAIVEAATRRELDASPLGERALALSAGTVRLLEDLGIWELAAQRAAPIRRIHVSDRGHFAKTRLDADEQGVEALGYVILGRDLERQAAEQAERAGVEVLYGARLVGLMSSAEAAHVCLKRQDESLNVTAALVVGADGGQSTVRRLLDIPQHTVDYGQTALVTAVHTGLPHHDTAFERFTPFGPLALLPLAPKEAAVIWTRSHEQARALMAGGETDFLAALQDCFGYRLGALRLSAPRRAFPLSLIRAGAMFSGRAVIVGNAAHQLHPVAGQGFNLGMRDAAALADLLRARRRQGGDLGAPDLLRRYQNLRQADHDQTIGFTDGLVRIFSTDWGPAAAARNFGLAVLDHLPGARRLLGRHAMGLARPLPNLGAESREGS